MASENGTPRRYDLTGNASVEEQRGSVAVRAVDDGDDGD